MREMFQGFFNVLNIPFTIMGISFTLLDVFYAAIICSLIGLALGKIFFFVFNER